MPYPESLSAGGCVGVGISSYVQDNRERFFERRNILGRKAALLIRTDPVNEGFESNPVPRGNASVDYLYFPSDLPV